MTPQALEGYIDASFDENSSIIASEQMENTT